MSVFYIYPGKEIGELTKVLYKITKKWVYCLKQRIFIYFCCCYPLTLAHILKKTVSVEDIMPYIYLAETAEKFSAEQRRKLISRFLKDHDQTDSQTNGEWCLHRYTSETISVSNGWFLYSYNQGSLSFYTAPLWDEWWRACPVPLKLQPRSLLSNNRPSQATLGCCWHQWFYWKD